MSLTVDSSHGIVPHYLSSNKWGPGGWKFLESKYQWDQTWMYGDMDGAEQQQQQLISKGFVEACGATVNQEITEARRQNLANIALINILPDRHYLVLFMHVIPGLKCRYNFHQFLQKFPPVPGKSCGQWIWELHNDVRRRTNKPLVSEEEARAQWAPSQVSDMDADTRMAILNFRTSIIYSSNALNHIQWHALEAFNASLSSFSSFSSSIDDDDGGVDEIVDMVSVSLGLIVLAKKGGIMMVFYYAPISDKMHMVSLSSLSSQQSSSAMIMEIETFGNLPFQCFRIGDGGRIVMIDTYNETVQINNDDTATTAAAPSSTTTWTQSSSSCSSMYEVRKAINPTSCASEAENLFGKLCYVSTIKARNGEPLIEVNFDVSLQEYVVTQRHYYFDTHNRHSQKKQQQKEGGVMVAEQQECYKRRCCDKANTNLLCIFSIPASSTSVHMLEDHFIPGLVLFSKEKKQCMFVPLNTACVPHSETEVLDIIKGNERGRGETKRYGGGGFGIDFGDEFESREESANKRQRQ